MRIALSARFCCDGRMVKHAIAPWLFAVLASMLAVSAAAAQDGQPSQATPRVLRLSLDGPVSPASASYIERGIRRAADQHMQAVLLEMDTPGGLDTSMRSIIKAILGSSVPVIGYVAPSGSRAASAGTYILYACHVSAMAPATNLGAATPIQLLNPGKPDGKPDPASASSAPPRAASAETRKAVNDAVAYIRSLAEQRGRNADWAEQAVRNAASLGARQALAAACHRSGGARCRGPAGGCRRPQGEPGERQPAPAYRRRPSSTPGCRTGASASWAPLPTRRLPTCCC